jgi:hypothetical protein
MRSIRLHLTIPGQPPAMVYRTLADVGQELGCYPGDCHVVISGAPDMGTMADWEASFRRGELHWGTENEVAVRPESGEVSVFDGSWSCVEDGDGTAVTFAARLDLGIAPPADAIETLAVQALVDDAVSIVAALFGGNVRVDDVVIQPHETATAPA